MVLLCAGSVGYLLVPLGMVNLDLMAYHLPMVFSAVGGEGYFLGRAKSADIMVDNLVMAEARSWAYGEKERQGLDK